MEIKEIVSELFYSIQSDVIIEKNSNLDFLEGEILHKVSHLKSSLFGPVSITYNPDTEEYVAILTYYYLTF